MTTRWKQHITKPSIPKYTILDVSPYEVTRTEKEIICNIPFPFPLTWTEYDFRQIVLELLGYDYYGPYIKDTISFVRKIVEIRNTDDKFDFLPVKNITLCNRDFIVDKDRKKLTCSNIRCKKCCVEY